MKTKYKEYINTKTKITNDKSTETLLKINKNLNVNYKYKKLKT